MAMDFGSMFVVTLAIVIVPMIVVYRRGDEKAQSEGE